jgi:hypothetical protein
VPGELTRAQLLGGGAKGGAALLLGGAASGLLASSAQANPPAASLGTIPASDLAYVRLLIAVELLTVDFYTQGIASQHLRPQPLADAQTALINENEHYDYLAAAIASAGGVALTAADVNFTYPQSGFYTAASVIKLAATLEQLALGAYLGVAGNLADPVLQAAVAQITANEAQHLAAFAQRSAQPAFRQAFPDPMTIEEASNALDAYAS